MEPSSEYITTKEASQITGFHTTTIRGWITTGKIEGETTLNIHTNNRLVSVESLFSHIDSLKPQYLRKGQGPVPKSAPIPARHLDPGIEACMNDVQRAAHEFLVNHPDKIECRRGGRLLLSVCQAYVKRHYGLSRCVGCVGCERYKAPKVLPKEAAQPILGSGPSQWDVHKILRDFDREAPQLFAAKETKERKGNPSLGDYAKKKSEKRMAAAKEKLLEAHKLRLAKKKAKRLKGNGKSFREIGKILGVSKTTAERYVTGKEFR